MTETNPDAAAQKKEREREYQRQWYLKNRERLLEKQKRYQVENRDRIREYQRRWERENRETKRRWRKANPDKVRAEQAKYRDYYRDYYYKNRDKWREQGRRRRHGVDLDTFLAMWEAQQRCCYLCGRELDLDKAAVDHWHGCPAHPPESSCRLCWRGLTHGICNIAIGQPNDDPAILRIIADNLERANAEVQERQRAVAPSITLF